MAGEKSEEKRIKWQEVPFGRKYALKGLHIFPMCGAVYIIILLLVDYFNPVLIAPWVEFTDTAIRRFSWRTSTGFQQSEIINRNAHAVGFIISIFIVIKYLNYMNNFYKQKILFIYEKKINIELIYTYLRKLLFSILFFSFLLKSFGRLCIFDGTGISSACGTPLGAVSAVWFIPYACVTIAAQISFCVQYVLATYGASSANTR